MSQESLVWDHPNNNLQDDEQQLRQELIQRATTRLRRRLLEQGLQDVLSQVVSLQTQLESLRLDATTTIDTISNIFDKENNNDNDDTSSIKMNRQMDVLERRLATHRSSLGQLVVPSTTIDDDDDENNSTKSDDLIPNSPTALTMSRLSSLSLMSSFFSRSTNGTNSTATSVSDQYSLKQESLMDDDCISQIENIRGDPFYDLSGKRSFKEGSFCGSVYHEQLQQELPAPVTNLSEIRWRRRQRRQRHQKHLEKQQYYSDDNESLLSDDLSSLSSISHQYDHTTTTTTTTTLPCHPLSTTPNIYRHPADNNYFMEKQLNVNELTQSWLSCTEFIQQQQYRLHQQQGENACLYPQRNVLDEAMSFLDGLGENGDDGGFGEDMYLLLGNPDLCCRPLSEVETTIQELRQQRQLNYFNPSTWCQLGRNVVYNTTCTSLQWCRFLSVLSAAVVISIMKGPEDVVSHSTF
ncbi:hypothetical protein HPULCUR_008561 [Helicostylum pulchrum]|uniref:Uncharacterized protein n=1 Tax=Helicostylum pulchrum TaxID=562976 RepID=A0ABP9Y7Y7_9FUNG